MIYAMSTAGPGLYLVHLADNFAEYMESFSFVLAGALILIIFIITIFQWTNISTLIHDAEKFVEKRKFDKICS